MPKKDEIIKRLIANCAEIITEEEFKQRLKESDPAFANLSAGQAGASAGKKKLTHYIGFEISGYVHIGQGIMSALVMKDLTDLGIQCTVWLADWHTWINDKLDGTKETAARIGEGYFKEAITASYEAVGGNRSDLNFLLASNEYKEKPMEYWEYVVNDMRHTSQARLSRSITIMGREEGKDVEGAKLLYPAMQAADVFFLKVDIAHAGTDQRKAYVIARDVAGKLAPNRPKPIIILHHLLPGLDSSERKMSKSDPASAIFVHDAPEEIKRKITKAFCPEKIIENNPVLTWTRHILFWNRKQPLSIKRKPEHGGDVEFETYEELEKAYAAGDVHPMDLKDAVAKELIELLKPVRDHFAQPEIAAKKAELDKILKNR